MSDAKLILQNKSLLPGVTKADFDELSADHDALSSDYSGFKQNTNLGLTNLQDEIDTVRERSLKVNFANLNDPWNNINPITHKAMWDWGDVCFVLFNGILLSRISYTNTDIEFTASAKEDFKMLHIYLKNKSATLWERGFKDTNWEAVPLTVRSLLIFTAST